jgi:hypothetical protein
MKLNTEIKFRLAPCSVLFVLPLILLFCCDRATAQIDCVYKVFRLRYLQGILYDQTGDTISGATVMLKQGKQTVFESKTDGKGRFFASISPGKYELLIEARDFKPVWSPIEIGTNLRNIFQSKTLRVVALVGSGDSCETLTTSRREFEKAVQAHNQRLKESH